MLHFRLAPADGFASSLPNADALREERSSAVQQPSTITGSSPTQPELLKAPTAPGSSAVANT